MRIIVSWDGSGHAIGTLRSVIGLFGEAAAEHIEIVLTVWPPRDIALWSDIQERQLLSDDLHRAAALVAAEDLHELEDLLRPLAKSIAASTTNGPFPEIIAAAVARTRADLLFIIAGTHDAHNVLQEGLRAVVAASTIPTLVLRPPAQP